MNYYHNKEYVSCSDLKAKARLLKGEPEPDWENMPAISFGREVDELLTDGRTEASPEAVALAETYRKKTATPYQTGKAQHEFYRSMVWRFEDCSFDLKMRGKLDLYYPSLHGGTVEDIKTTSLSTASRTAVHNFINRFDYDMQLYIYMNLSRANLGVISILSRTSGWLHQVFIQRDSEIYLRGGLKLKEHLKMWFEPIPAQVEHEKEIEEHLNWSLG